MEEDDTSMLEMPDDLIFRILLWLPVASLLRFKSVCSSWYTLIQSSDFVYSHHHHHKEGSKLRFMALYDRCEYGYQRYESDIQQFSSVSIHNSELLDFPIIDDPYHINPIKMVPYSSNGIVCLQQDRRICLWNPASKRSTNLPPLPILPLWCSICFAFDLKTNVFKVLCTDIREGNNVPYLYTPVSDCWTVIDSSCIPSMKFDEGLKALYRDHIYCWILFRDTQKAPNYMETVILTFDFSNEVFGTIPLPPEVDHKFKYLRAFFILRDNLACLIAVRVEGGQCFRMETWMLSDFNDGESWTKLYSIEPFQVDYRSIFYNTKNAFTNNNDDFLLFQRERENQLCLYNFVTREATTLPLQVSSYIYEVGLYSESLISIKRGGSSTGSVNSKDPSGRILIKESLTENNIWSGNFITKFIMYHILLWVPVVPLLRFKSVCKSWCSLIKSSDFVAQHIHQHQNANDESNFILHYSYGSLFKDSSHSSSITSFTCLLSAEKFELLDLPYTNDWFPLTIETSFDGIICLRDGDEKNVFLWNPAIKQFRAIPVDWHNLGRIHFGFGYDVKTKDYKVVRFRILGGKLIEPVQVYNLSTDCWRNIDDTTFPTVYHINRGLQALYRNGIYCWSAVIDCKADSYGILSFDFSHEVFEIIQPPDGTNSASVIKLTVLRENIACILMDKSEADNWHCKIWIMNEYGIKESWTVIYKLGPFSNAWRVQLGYSKKNRDYILLQREGQLYSCDLVTQEIKTLYTGDHATQEIKRPPLGADEYDVFLYKESLVPVRRRLC